MEKQYTNNSVTSELLPDDFLAPVFLTSVPERE